MRSPLEPEDGPRRHPSDEGTDNDTATVGAPFARIWVDDATTADDHQDADVFRMQPFPTMQKGGARTTYYGTWFTVCALVFGGAGDVGGLRFRRLGREPQHVERSSRITTRTGFPAGTATASFVFRHHGSASSQGDRTDVSRYTAEDHGDQCNQDVAGHDAEESGDYQESVVGFVM